MGLVGYQPATTGTTQPPDGKEPTMSIRDEVLEANEAYAEGFGDRGELALPRPGGSPS